MNSTWILKITEFQKAYTRKTEVAVARIFEESEPEVKFDGNVSLEETEGDVTWFHKRSDAV